MTTPLPPDSLPLRPDLGQLKRQAKELLAGVRAGDPAHISKLAQFHPEKIDPTSAKLADAQLALARSYGAPSWPRLVQCCEMIHAIWKNDLAAIRELVTRHPN